MPWQALHLNDSASRGSLCIADAGAHVQPNFMPMQLMHFDQSVKLMVTVHFQKDLSLGHVVFEAQANSYH